MSTLIYNSCLLINYLTILWLVSAPTLHQLVLYREVLFEFYEGKGGAVPIVSVIKDFCLSSVCSEVAAEIGFSVYPLGDEENPVYNQISMESETCSSHSTTDDGREDEGRTAPSEPGFPSYLSCRGCGQLRDGPLGPGIDLVGPYCLRCCKASRESKSTDFCSSFAGISGVRAGSHLQLEAMANGIDDKSLTAEDKLAKQHSCHLCGFSSRYANHVKRHMKTHNGEKPYHCPLCTYASAQLVNLQRHLRIHTGEKPYKCDRCTFACSSLGNLKRHQRMHVQTGGMGQDAAGPPALGQISQKRQMSGQRSNEEMSGASTKGRIHLLSCASCVSVGAFRV